jgi:hypothetical protein
MLTLEGKRCGLDVKPEVNSERRLVRKDKKMKKLCIALTLAGALAAPCLRAALVVQIDSGSAQSGAGGEFKATPGSGPWGALGITSPWETFCVEVDEHLTFGSSYTATFAYSADQGGNGGPSPDPLSKGTTYLYRQFLSNPGSIGYANTPQAAGDLQAAIWWLEEEIYTSGPDSVTLTLGTQAFLNAAGTALGLSWAQLQANAALGANGVGVFRLTSVDAQGNTIFNQDILAPVPEPTTIIAGALLLLPFGASTIRFIRKNRTA